MNNEIKPCTGDLETEVTVIDPEIIQSVCTLRKLGWGSKRIASELGIARNTVRRYCRLPEISTELQERPKGRRLDSTGAARAAELWAKEAQGNAVVVRRLLIAEGWHPALRTVQRIVAPQRASKHRQDVATTRYETAPGKQMQIDFGQKRVCIAGALLKVFVFVAVLGFSRRIFVQLGFSERQEDWQEGIAAAFAHFGGSTQRLLIDNPKAMVLRHQVMEDRRNVLLHPAFSAFCKDWGVSVQACAPYRARTKGKVESGVGYVKKNCLAGLSFTNFAALQAHVEAWVYSADRRIHGTTKIPPHELFMRDEQTMLTPLPQRPPMARTRRLTRKVANDCLVNVDTVRYSVPHRFVGETVMVEIGASKTQIYFGEHCIASHRRCQEAHQRVVLAEHYAGLLRPADAAKQALLPASEAVQAGPDATAINRSLEVYQAVVLGASS